MKIRKKLILGISSASLIAIVVASFSSNHEKRIDVSCEILGLGEITEIIPASGKIKPVVEVKISPDVSGEIVELYCKEGDYVEAGEILLKIKQDLYLSQVEQAEAALNTLKAEYLRQQAEVRQTESAFRRNERLLEYNAVSKADYEASRAAYEIAVESVKAAEFSILSGEAQLKEANENLLKTTIFAPMAGTISKVEVEKGERVVGTSQMAGTEMLRIADLSNMELLVDVSENDIVRISPGDSAELIIDAYPSRKFFGIVTQIANSAKNIGISFNQVTNFEVRIGIVPESYGDLLDQRSTPLLPGMSAAASIITRKKENVHTVPLKSIFTEGRDEFVWVVNEDEMAEKKKILTGIQDISRIEVTDGLRTGDKIITGPLSAISKVLTQGSKLRVDCK